MNALHLAQTIAEADETTFGKLIVGLPHLRHSKSLLTARLSLNPGLQVSQSGSGDVPELRIDIDLPPGTGKSGEIAAQLCNR